MMFTVKIGPVKLRADALGTLQAYARGKELPRAPPGGREFQRKNPLRSRKKTQGVFFLEASRISGFPLFGRRPEKKPFARNSSRP